MLFWYFFLVWRTFLFRFGLMKQLLIKEFPVMLFVPLNFGLFLADRLVRLQCIAFTKDWDILTLYDNWYYMLVFWVRNVTVVFMFAASLKAAIQVGNPAYYKPAKWLSV